LWERRGERRKCDECKRTQNPIPLMLFALKLTLNPPLFLPLILLSFFSFSFRFSLHFLNVKYQLLSRLEEDWRKISNTFCSDINERGRRGIGREEEEDEVEEKGEEGGEGEGGREGEAVDFWVIIGKHIAECVR
jgi:hypothetical protein